MVDSLQRWNSCWKLELIPVFGEASAWVRRVAAVGQIHRALLGVGLTFGVAGRFEIAQTLLDTGMDPNLGLVSAIRGRHSDVVQLLLEYGATRGLEEEEAIKGLSMKQKRDMMLI
jgi:hypothetical protein